MKCLMSIRSGSPLLVRHFRCSTGTGSGRCNVAPRGTPSRVSSVLHEPVLVGQDHELNAVAGTQFSQQPGDTLPPKRLSSFFSFFIPGGGRDHCPARGQRDHEIRGGEPSPLTHDRTVRKESQCETSRNGNCRRPPARRPVAGRALVAALLGLAGRAGDDQLGKCVPASR